MMGQIIKYQSRWLKLENPVGVVSMSNYGKDALFILFKTNSLFSIFSTWKLTIQFWQTFHSKSSNAFYYFSFRFEKGNFRESEDNVMRFPEIEGLILEKVIKYLHYKQQHSKATGTIPEFVIEPEIALELLLAASYLQCWLLQRLIGRSIERTK